MDSTNRDILLTNGDAILAQQYDLYDYLKNNENLQKATIEELLKDIKHQAIVLKKIKEICKNDLWHIANYDNRDRILNLIEELEK